MPRPKIIRSSRSKEALLSRLSEGMRAWAVARARHDEPGLVEAGFNDDYILAEWKWRNRQRTEERQVLESYVLTCFFAVQSTDRWTRGQAVWVEDDLGNSWRVFYKWRAYGRFSRAVVRKDDPSLGPAYRRGVTRSFYERVMYGRSRS